MKVYKKTYIYWGIIFIISMLLHVSFQSLPAMAADPKVKPEYLPPFLNLDVNVNVSSAAFSNVPMLIDTGISSFSDNKIMVQSIIKTMMNNSPSEYSLRIKLFGSDSKAEISEFQKNNSLVVITNAVYVSSLSQLNETNRNEGGRLGYESFEAPTDAKTVNKYYKEKGYKLSVDNSLKTTIRYFTNTEKRAVGPVLVQRSESVEDRSKELEFKNFLLTSSVVETALLWVLEALGLDVFNETQAGWITSILTVTDPIVEVPIPYGKAASDGILEDLVGGITSGVSVVTGIAADLGAGIPIVNDITAGINDGVREAEKCAQQVFYNVLCPKAIDTAIGGAQKVVFNIVPGSKILSDLTGGSLNFINGLLTNPGGFLKKAALGIGIVLIAIIFLIPFLKARSRRAGGA